VHISFSLFCTRCCHAKMESSENRLNIVRLIDKLCGENDNIDIQTYIVRENVSLQILGQFVGLTLLARTAPLMIRPVLANCLRLLAAARSKSKSSQLVRNESSQSNDLIIPKISKTSSFIICYYYILSFASFLNPPSRTHGTHVFFQSTSRAC
jgi:hypothetical protein